MIPGNQKQNGSSRQRKRNGKNSRHCAENRQIEFCKSTKSEDGTDKFMARSTTVAAAAGSNTPSFHGCDRNKIAL